LVDLERGDYAKARKVFKHAIQQLSAQKTPLTLVFIYLTPCDAHAQDWQSLTLHLDRATDLLRETGVVDIDAARTLEHAADLARQARKHTLARRVYLLSLTQWEALARDPEAGRVRASLQSLPAEAQPALDS